MIKYAVTYQGDKVDGPSHRLCDAVRYIIRRQREWLEGILEFRRITTPDFADGFRESENWYGEDRKTPYPLALFCDDIEIGGGWLRSVLENEDDAREEVAEKIWKAAKRDEWWPAYDIVTLSYDENGVLSAVNGESIAEWVSSFADLDDETGLDDEGHDLAWHVDWWRNYWR